MANPIRGRKNGFTIVELLIVVVIIAILAAVVIVSYGGIQQRAHKAAAASEADKVMKQLELARVANGGYPASITDCPAPALGNLCLVEPGAIDYLYVPLGAGGISSRTVLSPSYQLSILAESALLFKSPVERTSSNEFLQYVDLAPIIDRYGLRPYKISFDIKSANTATVSSSNMYFQNGSTSRYGGLSIPVPVTTAYVSQSYTFTPVLNNNTVTESWLAFYGTYGSGNIVTVKNMRIELGP